MGETTAFASIVCAESCVPASAEETTEDTVSAPPVVAVVPFFSFFFNFFSCLRSFRAELPSMM
jgi:hypothetical protein